MASQSKSRIVIPGPGSSTFNLLNEQFLALKEDPAKNTREYKERLTKLKEDTWQEAHVFWLYHNQIDPRIIHINRKLLEDIIEHFGWDLNEFPTLVTKYQ